MKKLIYLFLVWGCTLSVAAQDMKKVFIAMPDSLTPLLTKVNKEDCIDFLASNMKAEIKNRFDKSSEMKVLTEDYLQMQMTENSTLEMKLFPVNDSVKIVCMVKTVCSSACDSEIRFYDISWKKEFPKSDYLQLPAPQTFYLPTDTVSSEVELIKRKADMHVMKAVLSEDDSSLSFIYTTPDYLNQEDREKLSPYLRKEAVVYRWKDGKFLP
ncbi:MAG: DUF3256 family protein [Bacteroides sp.]|nr:DUF3256 family protein [Bacteroides sp.]